MRGVVSLSAVLLSVGCQGFDGQTYFARATIGAGGGQLESLDGFFKIIIPAGALVQDEEFRIEDLAQPPRGAIGPAYEVRPNISLAMDAQFIYDFSAINVGSGRDLNLLNIAANFRFDNRDRWTPLQRESVDTTVRTVTAIDSDIGFYYGLIQDDSLSGETDGTDSDTSDMTAGTTDTTGPGPMTSTSEAGNEDSSESTTGELPETGTETESSTTDTTAVEESTSSGTTTDGTSGCEDGNVDPGEVCLAELVSFSAPDGASAVLAIDINGDGNLDAVIAGDSTLHVLHGNGAGILRDRETYAIGAAPVALTTGDFGGDAALDVAVLSGGDNEVGVMLNASGALEDVVSIELDSINPVALLAARLNSGTDLDLAVLNQGDGDVGGQFSIAIGDGEGGLSLSGSSPIDTVEGAVAFASGDFNGDDDLDIVTVSAASLGVSAGNGMGLFGAPTATAIGDAGLAMATGDFNGDGRLDVVVATDADTVIVFPGNGIGGFGAGVPYSVGGSPGAVISADVSGDDIPDIITANAVDGSVSILIGRSNGGVADVVTLPVGDNPSAIAVGDYNNDGAADIIVTNFDDGEVSLLLSSP